MLPEITIKPRILNRTQAATYAGGEELINLLEAEFGLRPIIKRNRRLYRWDVADIDASLEKLKSEEQGRY